jgi:hypothetical protein
MTDAPDSADAPPRRGLIGALEALAEEAPEEGVTLGALAGRLGERAFGVVLFALAIPVCMPFLYGVPQIVALPMMALAVQMAMGRATPWMPRRFAGRVIDRPSLERMATGARKWFGWMEALARPRLRFLSGPVAERVIGVFFVLFCLSILTPLPLTNSTPGVALAIAALGLINRDGLLILGGLVLGTVWIVLLFGGLIILGPAVFDLFREAVRWLLGQPLLLALAAVAGVIGLAALILIGRRRR